MSDSDAGHDSQWYERRFPEAERQFYTTKRTCPGCPFCEAGICTQRVIEFWGAPDLIIHGLLEGSQWHS